MAIRPMENTTTFSVAGSGVLISWSFLVAVLGAAGVGWLCVGVVVVVVISRLRITAGAEPGQRQQPRVECQRLKVPPIGEASDQRQGVHGPIEAEHVRAEEEPDIDGRQVEEVEAAGQENGPPRLPAGTRSAAAHSPGSPTLARHKNNSTVFTPNTRTRAALQPSNTVRWEPPRGRRTYRDLRPTATSRQKPMLGMYTHVEEEVGGGQERDGHQAYGEHHHVLSGGERSPHFVELPGAVLGTAGMGWLCVGVVVVVVISRLRITAGVAVSVAVAVSIAAVRGAMRLPVGLLALGLLLRRSQAEPGQRQQPRVECQRLKVPPIGEASDQRQGVHGPIEAEHVRAEEEPDIDGRQVEEVEAAGQENGPPGCQQEHVQQQ
ncbi:hypothetical protein CRUP_003092, partial [Coryphaenoides rupestris]